MRRYDRARDHRSYAYDRSSRVENASATDEGAHVFVSYQVLCDRGRDLMVD